MRIWLITVGEPLPLPGRPVPRLLRTGTLAETLVRRGHDVTWWTSTFDHFAKRHHVPEDTSIRWAGGTIEMLKSVGYSRNLSPARFVEHAGVARKFASRARATQPPDVILASLPTLELAREAVRFGLERNVPVLVDVRDLWPDLILDLIPARLRVLGNLLFSSMIHSASFALSQCSGVIGVSDGYLAWGLKGGQRARGVDDAVFPLGYVAPRTTEAGVAAAGERLTALGVDVSKTICWYVGTFGRQYDLAPVLEAASRLQQAGRRDLQFVISGDGDNGPRWRALAAGNESVIFTGWVGGDEINWLRAHSAIGLQPYAAGAPQGLANKLFEYLSAGIPVVSSLAGENQALIERYDCGVSYQVRDTESCLAAIRRLADEPTLRQAMGARGRALFEAHFDKDVVFEGLADHLEAVSRRHATQSQGARCRSTI